MKKEIGNWIIALGIYITFVFLATFVSIWFLLPFGLFLFGSMVKFLGE